MSPVKHEALLQGQSALARKVYEVVPIQEAWSPARIQAALKASCGSTAEVRVVHGCLRALHESRLIRQPTHGVYQRSPAPLPNAAPAPQPKEPSMSQPKPTPKKPTPLELLSGLANDLQALAKEFDQRIQLLAAHAEDIALVIEQQRETDAAQLAKLRQLQTLLTSLGEPA